jgi:hypothetical protein
MASLITKVDEEFDKQVVPDGTAVASNVDSGKTFINSTGQLVTGTSTKVSPAGTAVASNVDKGKTFINSTGQLVTGTSTKVSPAGTAVAENVMKGKTFINSTGQLVTGTGNIINKINQAVNIDGTEGTVTVNHNAGVIPNVIMARLYGFKIHFYDRYVNPLFIDSRTPSIVIKEIYTYEGSSQLVSGSARLTINIKNITENTFDIEMSSYLAGDVDYIKCTIDFVIVE